MKVYHSITELIGGTPLVELTSIKGLCAKLYAKLEFFNPAGSAKDRVALSMLNDAEEMMDEFDIVREIAKSEEHPRKYVNEWFREQFPTYGKVAKLDENHRIIHKNVA